MANKDAAFGFRPTRSLVGGQLRTEEYAIAANYNTSIFTGQVVEAVAAGGIEASSSWRHTTSWCFRWMFLY